LRLRGFGQLLCRLAVAGVAVAFVALTGLAGLFRVMLIVLLQGLVQVNGLVDSAFFIAADVPLIAGIRLN
jgi:hypothetical protein